MMLPSDAEDAGAPALRPIETACWGAQLNGGASCLPNFVPGKLHFKNNFCDACRESIIVPLAYVRALSPEQAERHRRRVQQLRGILAPHVHALLLACLGAAWC